MQALGSEYLRSCFLTKLVKTGNGNFSLLCHSYRTNWDIETFSTSKWPSGSQWLERIVKWWFMSSKFWASPSSIEKEIALDLKPNFPFDSKTSSLIEDYMCRIHKSLKDINGQGLPLDNYLKTLRGIFRDKRRILPRMFCGRTYHTRKDLEC